jgi:uncharacterized protein
MTRGSSCARRLAGFALPLLLAASLAALAADATPAAQGLQPIPRLAARVTDLTGTLTAAQQTALEQKLAAFEAAKGSQLAVLIVPTTQPEDIFQYSFRVADTWKLGRKAAGAQKVDDGALLVIAKSDRHLWIQVGYGLEGVLTDAMCKRIVDETITPAFRAGNFYAGIDAGVDQMMKLIEGEPLPPPEQSWQGGRHRGAPGLLPELLFAILIGSVALRAIFGRTLGSLFTGAGAGALVWLGGYALAFAALAAVGAFLLALLLGVAGGSGWSSYPRTGGFGGGFGGGLGGGFGGGGLGGGGGGFSGGGGGFGGGGAGGSW